jgi:hypothetical protein
MLQVYWGYSAKDRGSRTLFGDMGMTARISGCPATLGGPTLLTSRLNPHSY